MSILTINVHKTKLLYATILKGLALWGRIRLFKELLTEMLPDIDTQWDTFKTVITPGISRPVTVMASLSMSDDVPSETRTAPMVSLNADVIRLIHALAEDRGLTLNGKYDWNDETDPYMVAGSTWSTVIGCYLEIEQLVADLTMHRANGADLYTDNTVSRTPGQLTSYTECDAPLASGIFVASYSRKGLKAGFGNTYLGWLNQSTEALVMEAPPAVETDQVNVTATPEDDPDNPGIKTRYKFEVSTELAAEGWALGGLILAAQPDLSSPGTFYPDMIDGQPDSAISKGIHYESATAGSLHLIGAYDGPDVPPTVEFKMLLIKSS